MTRMRALRDEKKKNRTSIKVRETELKKNDYNGTQALSQNLQMVNALDFLL